MRTLIIIVGDLVLLGVCLLAARWIGAGAQPMANVAKIFIAVWLAAALFNMWVGVSRAGYSVPGELPIFLAIFAIPVAVASLVWWRLS
jgi:hypothetical protein